MPKIAMILWSALALSACSSDPRPATATQTALHCSQASDCPGSSQCVADSCRCQSASDCGSDLACDDGACVAHRHGGDDARVDAAAASCQADSDCGGGLECEHGQCAPHGGHDADAGVDDNSGHQGKHDAGNNVQVDAAVGCQADSDCGTGLECEHGQCAPHGGQDDVDGGSHESGEHAGGEPEGSEGGSGKHGGKDDGAAGAPATPATTCQSDAECAAGLECEDGVCAKHGGRG
jgi:hypothetical protein